MDGILDRAYDNSSRNGGILKTAHAGQPEIPEQQIVQYPYIQTEQSKGSWCDQSIWHKGNCYLNKHIGPAGMCISAIVGLVVIWVFKDSVLNKIKNLVKNILKVNG